MMRIRLPAIGLLLLISSNAWADLKTYDVDVQHQQEVYQALRNVLVDNPQFAAPGLAMGRVHLLPSGQILVDAAPETLEQVEEVLRAIRERPAPAAPRVSLRYWAVLGAASAAGAPSAAQVPSVLNGVLTELERFHGKLGFRVIGTAAVVTESGQQGGVEGRLSVEQTAYVQGQALNANIRMVLDLSPDQRALGAPGFVVLQGAEAYEVGELEVRATLERGEFVVVGESTQQGNGLDGTLFYIVHWPENQ
jgi:hypothetical protein